MEITLSMEIKRFLILSLSIILEKNYTNPLNHFCDFVVWNKLVKEKKIGPKKPNQNTDVFRSSLKHK